MKAGTYAVIVSGFLTKEMAEHFDRQVRGEGFDESGLESDVTTPEIKSFKVQEAEREAGGSSPEAPVEA